MFRRLVSLNAQDAVTTSMALKGNFCAVCWGSSTTREPEFENGEHEQDAGQPDGDASVYWFWGGS